MFSHLHHLHQLFEEATVLFMISIYWYANFAFGNIKVMEVSDPDYWYIALAAHYLTCLNGDQLNCVNLWSQLSMSSKFLPHAPVAPDLI
jgi:hypothetical protein